MSKYFKFNHTEHLKYPEDVVKIRKYLESVGKVDCTDKEIEKLWYEFSETWSASWLTPREGDKGDTGTLAPFADWLAYYDEDHDYSKDVENEDEEDDTPLEPLAPCWMREHCPYRSCACFSSQPEDDGCYVYRRFKEIFKKQGLL